MRRFLRAVCVAVATIMLAAPDVMAQQTTGNISGRIVDDQGSAVPGVTVTGKNTQTGFTRTDVSDGEGIYRLSALPVGTYDITAELQGFSKVENKGIVLSVGQTLDVGMSLKVASLQESITVSGETPLIETGSSSIGGVVDVGRIESLPLNGRQFANAAITIPGVGLGFHSDPTKSTQFSPQIAGGNGRNVNYQIDGGDNNDDTVGGLLQLFPLEAIQEFNFVTSRYKAEYGRSNGGVMNIITKSGTNDYRGSWFTMYRDEGLNGKTETEKRAEADKQDYKRWQYGGSAGGPIARDKAHFFGALRAHAAGHVPGRQHARAVPGSGRRLHDPLSREPPDRQRNGADDGQPVPGGSLRPEHQHAAVRRRPADAAERMGPERQRVQLDQPEPQPGARRVDG